MLHMVVGILVGIGQIEMTQSDMEISWIIQIGEVMDIGTILLLVLSGIMVIIVIILIGGVIGDIFWMSSRKKRHIHSMGK